MRKDFEKRYGINIIVSFLIHMKYEFFLFFYYISLALRDNLYELYEFFQMNIIFSIFYLYFSE